MDEKNNLQDNQNNEQLEEQSTPTPNITKINEPTANIPTSKKPIPKIAFIVGGAIAGVAAIAIILSIILGGGGGHMHNYGAWFAVDVPTCTKAGSMERVCECGENETRSVDALSHQFINYEYNKDYHWSKCCICNVETQSAHTENAEGVCSTCEYIMSPTPGVIYDISFDGTYAGVVDYNGSSTKVLIAETYQGVPVTTIYNLAFNNRGVTEVIIPDGVTTIGDKAFQNCSRLTSIVIPDSVTSIGDYAFFDCESLTSVVIPGNVTSINFYAFKNCTSLRSVVIGDGVEKIDVSAFERCSSLTSVVIPNSVTSIDRRAFYYCSSLTSVVIGDRVTSIGNEAFAQCHSLTSILIPGSVTSIGDCAFYNCKSLTFVVISDGVAIIGEYAFAACDRLRDVCYTGSEENWKWIYIGYPNIDLTNATIHYNYVPKN